MRTTLPFALGSNPGESTHRHVRSKHVCTPPDPWGGASPFFLSLETRSM